MIWLGTFFDLTFFLEARAEILKKFRWYFGQEQVFQANININSSRLLGLWHLIDLNLAHRTATVRRRRRRTVLCRKWASRREPRDQLSSLASRLLILLWDHPFKTSAICRGGGVKNWSNLPTDSSKKLPTEGGRGQK